MVEEKIKRSQGPVFGRIKRGPDNRAQPAIRAPRTTLSWLHLDALCVATNLLGREPGAAPCAAPRCHRSNSQKSPRRNPRLASSTRVRPDPETARRNQVDTD